MKVRNIYMTGLFIIWPVRDRWKEGLDHQEDHLLLTASEQASCSRLKILVTVPCARRCIRNAGRIHLPANWRVLKQQAQVYKKKEVKSSCTHKHTLVCFQICLPIFFSFVLFFCGGGGVGGTNNFPFITRHLNWFTYFYAITLIPSPHPQNKQTTHPSPRKNENKITSKFCTVTGYKHMKPVVTNYFHSLVPSVVQSTNLRARME